MDTQKPTIKLAKVEDVPHILALVKELAIHQNAVASVEATEDTLAHAMSFEDSSGTSSPGYAKALILRVASDVPGKEQHVVAGIATFYHTFSTWHAKPGIFLDDLYVRPQYRRRGYGKLLIESLAKQVITAGGTRLEWSCLKWNVPSLQFYRELGAEEMNDRVRLRVDGKALEHLGIS